MNFFKFSVNTTIMTGSFPSSCVGCRSPSPNLQRRKWTLWLWADPFRFLPYFFIKASQFADVNFRFLCVAGSAYCLWSWRCQISQRHWHSHVHLQHLHGWQVCMNLCANISHHVTKRCIFKFQTASKSLVTLWQSFPSFLCFFFLFQVLQQLRRGLSDWWGKGLLMFSLSYITRTMIAQFPVLVLPQISFPAPLFVCLSL